MNLISFNCNLNCFGQTLKPVMFCIVKKTFSIKSLISDPRSLRALPSRPVQSVDRFQSLRRLEIQLRDQFLIRVSEPSSQMVTGSTLKKHFF